MIFRRKLLEQDENGKWIPKKNVSTQDIYDELAKYQEKNYTRVIRCKDCKYYTDESLGWCEHHSHFTDEYMENWTIFIEQDYCSWAEHK